MSSPREREERDRGESRGDEREGQGRKRNRNESEETEEIKTFPLQGLTNQKKIHLPSGQVNFFFTCPAQIPTCPGFVRLKFLYAQDLQTEIEVPLLTLR